MKQLESLNLEQLRAVCREYIEFLGSDDYHEDSLDDYQNYIFEAALEAVYGKDIWDYVREKMV